MTGDDLYNVVIAINSIIQKLLVLFISNYVLRPKDGKCPSDPGKELYQVINKDFNKFAKKVKAATRNKKKLHENPIIISLLDSQLLLEMLIYYEELLDFKAENYEGKCSKHDENCCGSCNHSLKTCVKCNSNSLKPTERCNHPCKKCKAQLDYCKDLKTICCKSCNVCKHCHLKNFESKQRSGCYKIELIECFKFMLLFRNVFGHYQLSNYEEFLKNAGDCLGEMKNIKNYTNLQEWVKFVIRVVLDYSLDDEDKKNEFLDNVDCVLKNCKTIKSQSLDLEEIKKIFSGCASVISYLEEYKKSICSEIEKNRELLKNIKDNLIGQPQEEKLEKEPNETFDLVKFTETSCVLFSNVKFTEEEVRRFTMRKHKDPMKDDVLSRYTWTEIKDYRLKHDGFTTLIWFKESFSSGYLYSFQLDLMEDKEVLMIKLFNSLAQGKCESINVTPDSKVILVAYNDAKQNNVHFMKQIQEPESQFRYNEFQKMLPTASITEFKSLSKKYFKSINYNERIPPKYLIPSGSVRDFGDLFEDVLDEKYIITNPQLAKQLKTFGFTSKQLDDLQLLDHDKKRSLCIFSVSEMIILYICLTDGTTQDSIVKEIKRCNGDLKAFRTLHEKVLNEKYVTLCGVVACPNISREDIKNLPFVSYHNIFLTKDDKYGNALKVWWNDLVLEVNTIKDAHDPETTKEQFLECCTTVCGEMIATMSCVDLSLPEFSKNLANTVKSQLLNIEQTKVINDGSHKIIIGPYGSGKSIVLKEMAKRLSMWETQIVIYFVCCDPYSLLECRLHNENGNINIKVKNFKDMAEEASVAYENASLAKVIAIHCKKESRPVAFLFDEVDGEMITDEVADEFNEVLKHKNLHFLVLAMQSIKKKRNMKIKDKEISIPGNRLKKTGMKIVELRQRMRMTGRNNELIKVTERCLEKFEKTFYIPAEKSLNETVKNNVDKKPRIPGSSGTLNEQPEYSKRSSYSNKKLVSSEVAAQANPVPDKIHDLSVQISELAESYQISEENRKKSQDQINNQEPSRNFGQYLDADESAEGLITSADIAIPFTSKYKCISGDIGHNLEGDLPQIIYLHQKFGPDSQSGNVLSIILNEKCIRKRKKLVILCCSRNEALLTIFALKKLKVPFATYINFLKKFDPPSYQEKVSICNKIVESNVLVTDYRGFRGCESEHCLVFVRQESSYKNHVLVEILARAITYIDVLVLPPQSKMSSSSTNEEEGNIYDVIQEWERAKDENDNAILTFHKVAVAEDKIIFTSDSQKPEVRRLENDATDEETWNAVKDEVYGNRPVTGNFDEISSYPSYFSRWRTDEKSLLELSQAREIESSPFFDFKSEDWEYIEFLPKCFQGEVQLRMSEYEQRYHVQFRFSKQKEKFEIMGDVKKKVELASYLIEEYGAVIFDVGDQEQEEYNVLVNGIQKNTKENVIIRHDDVNRQISSKGPNKDIQELRVNIYNKYWMKDYTRNDRYVFLSGVSPNAFVNLEKSSTFDGLSTVKLSREEIIQFKTGFVGYKIPGLYGVILRALEKAKDTMRGTKEAMCSVLLHGGRLFSNLPQGKYSLRQAFSRKTLWYKRFGSADLNLSVFNNVESERQIYRYDMTIFTPYPFIKCKYKVYIRKNDNGEIKFITSEQAGEKKPSFSSIRVGPGYIEIPSEMISRIDIANPLHGFTTRVVVGVTYIKEEYMEQLRVHLPILENFFKQLQIKDDTSFCLLIPTLPYGYFISYCRKSERKVYNLPNNIALKTSKELLLDNYELAERNEITDVFIDDLHILNKLDYTDWNPKDITESFESLIIIADQQFQELL